MGSSSQAAVFVLPTQSIDELLQNQRTTSVVTIIMMYCLVCCTERSLGLSAEACGSQILPVEGRDDPLPCRDTMMLNREYFCTILEFFSPFKKTKLLSEVNYSFSCKICQLSSPFWGFNGPDVL